MTRQPCSSASSWTYILLMIARPSGSENPSGSGVHSKVRFGRLSQELFLEAAALLRTLLKMATTSFMLLRPPATGRTPPRHTAVARRATCRHGASQ